MECAVTLGGLVQFLWQLKDEIKDDVDGCEFPNLDCGVVVEGERDVWGGIYELSKTVSFGGVKVVHIGKEL